MASESRRKPRCSDSWRPSDDPLPPQAVGFQRQQSPIPLEKSERCSAGHTPYPRTQQYANIDQRLAPMSTQAAPQLKNPNLTPVVPRRSHRTTPSSPTRDLRLVEKVDEERLPQIWHTSIDELIRRTAHDYDLVMNYQRDAEGGQRWLPGDIAHIRDAGKNLHRDIFALRRGQRVVAQQGDQDKTLLMHIKREASFLKSTCERIQRTIVKYEQKCEFELLRDGLYAQDEDGNFYKPITPQKYVADGGYLQNVPQLSTESMEYDNWGFPQVHDQDVYQDYGGTARCEAPSDTGPSSLPKRGSTFDSTFHSTPFDELERKAAHQKSGDACQPPASRSGRVPSGRISKSYRGSSRGKFPL